jgi:hypothetical protein
MSERQFHRTLERELLGSDDSAEGDLEHTKKKQSRKAGSDT